MLETIFPHHYTGRLSTTSSGRTCQRWDSQYPHPHDAGSSNSSFPDGTVEDAKNYCRDPTMEGTLFCYTTDPDREWEPCNYKGLNPEATFFLPYLEYLEQQFYHISLDNYKLVCFTILTIVDTKTKLVFFIDNISCKAVHFFS